MLWSCCSPEKHEDIIRSTYDVITEIAGLLPLPRVKFMYDAIKTIPMHSMDAKTVNFLRGYTLATFSNLNRIKNSKDNQERVVKQTKGTKISERNKRATVVSTGEVPGQEPAQKTSQNDFQYVDCHIFWDIF